MTERKAQMMYYKYLFLSILLTIIGAIIGEKFVYEFVVSLNPVVMFILLIGSLIVTSISKDFFKKFMFYMFCFLEGLFLSPILRIYTDSSLISAFGITLVVLLIFSFIGYKINFKSSFGRYLFVSLIATFIYLIASIIIPLPSISFIMVIIFSLYIAYDTNCFIKRAKTNTMDKDEVIDCVINIYLDVLNIFLDILQIFGND